MDHTEFMVLALQLDDVYRESILGFASKKALGGKRIALVNPTLVSTWFSVLPGFAPAGEDLLFRQKDPITVALFETQHSTVTPRSTSSN
jgi:hypothetical protein